MPTSKLGGRRPGAGRKRSVGGKKTKGMGILLGDDLKADLKTAARDLGLKVGDLIRRVLRRGLTDKQLIVTIRSEIEKEKESRHGKADE